MIGVNKDLKNKFSSHAWIELNDLIFYENIEKFKVIKRNKLMSGISGIFSKNSSDLKRIDLMSDALSRRGPDGTYKVYTDLFSSSYNWLKILKNSFQYHDDSEFVIMIDGKIFNNKSNDINDAPFILKVFIRNMVKILQKIILWIICNFNI